MTETTTPTGDSNQDSSGITNEPLLEEQNTEQTTAVEETKETDTDTGEQSHESGSDDNSSTTEESSSDNSDKDIEAFAKSQGYDLTQMSETEKKLIRQLRENSVEKRKEIDAEASKKLDKDVNDLFKPNEGSDDKAVIAAIQRKQLLQDEKIARQDYFANNPEDRKYEAKMAEILAKEKEQYGEDAAWRLLNNLPRLVREAKFADGAFDSDAARESGRREEREELRRRQEAGADTAHASTPTANSAGKIDRAWVESTYDPNNPEHQKLLDEAMARGELY